MWRMPHNIYKNTKNLETVGVFTFTHAESHNALESLSDIGGKLFQPGCDIIAILKVILEERAWELQNATKPLRRGEVLSLYLETHLHVSHLSRRLSSTFHPTLFLSFLADIVLTIVFAFFIISWALENSWPMVAMSLAKTLFCNSLLVSLCRTADGGGDQSSTHERQDPERRHGIQESGEEPPPSRSSLEPCVDQRRLRRMVWLQVMHFQSQTRCHQVRLQASGYLTLDKALLASIKGRPFVCLTLTSMEGKVTTIRCLRFLISVGAVLGILPIRNALNMKNGFAELSVCLFSFPSLYAVAITISSLTSMIVFYVVGFQYFIEISSSLGDQVGNHVCLVGGLGAFLTYVFSHLSLAKRLPPLMIELESVTQRLEPLVGPSNGVMKKSYGATVRCFIVVFLCEVTTTIIMVSEVSRTTDAHGMVYVVSTGFMLLSQHTTTCHRKQPKTAINKFRMNPPEQSFLLQILTVCLEEKAFQLQRDELVFCKRPEVGLRVYWEMHRDVWKLSRSFSSAFHPTLILSLATMIVSNIVYIYFSFSKLMDHNWSFAATAVFRALFFDVLIVAVARGADRLTSKSEEMMQSMIDFRNPPDKDVQIQAMYLLNQTRSHPVQITASGYFVLNKALLISIASNVVTYLIVLLEYRMG
ncbi:unnamed protein product [Darwinula stevensoni]|uniref:Gustatory receptor n=1 Tax=Darwinula stevensoni TaxID=69355 RepID=A0A7R8XDG1_9CRUS|nr:unnamed protein product [Darwinula stevensoni]CAG0886779.1 unnamed protein product [Darwinula stevensoni]